MIKVKCIDVMQSKDSLEKLLNIKFDKFSTARKIAKNVKAIQDEIIVIENERNKLIKSYGTYHESDDTWRVESPESRLKFNQEFLKILESEIELNIDKIDISTIPEKVDFTTKDVLYLEPFFDEIEVEKSKVIEEVVEQPCACESCEKAEVVDFSPEKTEE